MSKVKEIENSVAKLPREELAEFRAWFEEFDARNFDTAIEQDIDTGKLDRLAEEVLAEHKNGRNSVAFSRSP
ncbi:MAG: hypothetical protein ACLQIQ_14660 [Beijerinckiaceae bacterium]